MADLKQTIFYLENVADTKGDGERAAKLAAMAGKLKNALARIEDELTSMFLKAHRENYRTSQIDPFLVGNRLQ